MNLNLHYFWPLLPLYVREKAWFEAQTQATVFPDFWTWLFQGLTPPADQG